MAKAPKYLYIQTFEIGNSVFLALLDKWIVHGVVILDTIHYNMSVNYIINAPTRKSLLVWAEDQSIRYGIHAVSLSVRTSLDNHRTKKQK